MMEMHAMVSQHNAQTAASAMPVGHVKASGQAAGQHAPFANVLVHVMGNAGQTEAQPGPLATMSALPAGANTAVHIPALTGEQEQLMEQLLALLDRLAQNGSLQDDELQQSLNELQQLLAQAMQGWTRHDSAHRSLTAAAQTIAFGEGSGAQAWSHALQALMADLKQLQQLSQTPARASELQAAFAQWSATIQSALRASGEAMGLASHSAEAHARNGWVNRGAFMAASNASVSFNALQAAASRPLFAQLTPTEGQPAAVVTPVQAEAGAGGGQWNAQAGALRTMPVFSLNAMFHSAAQSGAVAGDEADVQQPSPIQEAQPTMAQPLAAATRPAVEAPVARSEAVPVPIHRFAADMGEWFMTSLRMQSAGGVSEASFSLHPEHLGHVQVKLTMQNGQLVAQFIADTLAGKEAIESQLAHLRVALQNQGIQVEKLEVSQTMSGLSQFSDQRENASSRSHHGEQGDSRKKAEQLEQSIAEFADMLEDLPHAPHGLYGSSFEATA